MKIEEINKIQPWHFKNSDDILDEPEVKKVITCPPRYQNGDTFITLPSKLNGDNYSKYGVVKPVSWKAEIKNCK